MIPAIFASVALLSLAGCVLVVYFVHGKTVGIWMGIQPNVILALLAAIFGFSVKIIFLAGVTIVWWRTLKDGTTLATLHYIWNKGMGESMSETLMAVRQSPRAKWVILVFLGVTAVDIWDGAIMQRSVKPVNANLHQDYESIFHLADHIQDGWTGTVSHGFFGNLIWSNWFDGVARILYHGQLPLEKHNCDGTCYGSAIGAGINATCSQSQQILNPPTTRDDHTVVLFGIQANRTVDSRGAPALQLEHRFVKDMDEKCVATIGVESCVIRSGTVLYDLIHRGKNVSLGTDQFPSLRTLKPNNGDLPNAPNGSNAGPLAGIHSFIDMFLSSKVVLHPVDLGIPTSYMRFKHYGTIDTGYYDPPLANETKNDSCPFRYRNATDDILWQLHDMMFRMAADSVLGERYISPLIKKKYCRILISVRP